MAQRSGESPVYHKFIYTISPGLAHKCLANLICDGIIIPAVERYTRGGIRACMEV